MTSPNGHPQSLDLQPVADLVARLRAPDGCPWDQEQTLEQAPRHLLEETCELIDAIEDQDLDAIREEIGDVLFQLVFIDRLVQDEQRQSPLSPAIQDVVEKMIERHPHVFGDDDATTSDDVRRAWERRKASSRSILEGVPRSQPALQAALRMSEKAAAFGFDWTDRSQIREKILEEIAEIEAAKEPSEVEEEFGDLLFALANHARHSGVDPEQALRRANQKFRRRFQFVESQLGPQLSGEEARDEMERLWDLAKQRSV